MLQFDHETMLAKTVQTNYPKIHYQTKGGRNGRAIAALIRHWSEPNVTAVGHLISH